MFKIAGSVTFMNMMRRPARTRPQQDIREPSTKDNIYRTIVPWVDIAFVLNCDQSAFDEAAVDQ